MKDVIFLEWEELLLLHVDQLGLYRGQSGFIDESVVRSVIARAQFSAQYNEDADLADLAADYMFGLATTQGFMDGNKRTALVAAERFLRKNGWRTVLTPRLMHVVAMAVAWNELDRGGWRRYWGIIWRHWRGMRAEFEGLSACLARCARGFGAAVEKK